MPDTTNNSRLLELAPAELVIPLKVTHAGRTYRVRHVLRPPQAPDWFAYEAALEMAVEELPGDAGSAGSDSDEPAYRLQMRSTDAALLLWERLLLRLEGYALPGDSRERELVPLAHKEAAVRALTLVAPAQPAPGGPQATNPDFPLFAEEVPVVLEAVRGGTTHPRLVHRFRAPSVEHERAYRRLLAENLIVRGTRYPRTLIPARLPALARLYDQLVLGVEGYALDARPLASPADVARAMDAWHKRVAVQALFGDLSAETPTDRRPAELAPLPEPPA